MTLIAGRPNDIPRRRNQVTFVREEVDGESGEVGLVQADELAVRYGGRSCTENCHRP